MQNETNRQLIAEVERRLDEFLKLSAGAEEEQRNVLRALLQIVLGEE